MPVIKSPAQDDDIESHINMINREQFKIVSKLFDDYYNMHEPRHEKYEAIKELNRKLNRKKVLNVNVVENEFLKIKKENMG